MNIDKNKLAEFKEFKKYCDINKYYLNQEIIDRYKNGNKIHIKKKNKGKFTQYCNGKVTNECIQRAKNSSNPTLRKRAIFAENARKWNK